MKIAPLRDVVIPQAPERLSHAFLFPMESISIPPISFCPNKKKRVEPNTLKGTGEKIAAQ